MKFTYEGYEKLIQMLFAHGYTIVSYRNWQSAYRPCILRHDVDNSLEKAVTLAELEASIGVKSTYFVLISSDFYNVFSRHARDSLNRIIACGHEIGLHFDETVYPKNSEPAMIEHIREETERLQDVLPDGRTVSVVSMHRPSPQLLEKNMVIPGLINSYSDTYFHEFKYVSDSHRRWREDVLSYVENETYNKLHILTHAFWYHDCEKSLKETSASYIREGSHDRYRIMDENFMNLAEALEGETP